MNPVFDVRTLLSAQPCDNALTRQFGENLLRAATGQPSLQIERVAIKDAQRASDRGFLTGDFGGIGEACWHDLAYETRAQKFCVCAERTAVRLLSPAEIARFTKDFAAFKSEMLRNSTPTERVPAGHPSWQINQCRT